MSMRGQQLVVDCSSMNFKTNLKQLRISLDSLDDISEITSSKPDDSMSFYETENDQAAAGEVRLGKGQLCKESIDLDDSAIVDIRTYVKSLTRVSPATRR